MAESTLSVLKRTYTEWSSHNAMRLAAAMAFYTMMSLAPLLVVALTALTFIYKDKAQSTIQNRAALLVGNNGAGAITEMLQASTSTPPAGSVQQSSALSLPWSAPAGCSPAFRTPSTRSGT